MTNNSTDYELSDLEHCRAVYFYEPETGLLKWLKCHYQKKNGTEVGTLHHDGYRVVKIRGRFHRVHRVIWLMNYGEWPSDSIDHINGDKLDNRLSNLRVVSVAQNQWNRVKPNNAVFWHATNQRWTVSLKVNGRLLNFGSFIDKSKAIETANKAIKDHHGEYARR